jgi:GMP synthase (glutamine-hydrolysing)
VVAPLQAFERSEWRQLGRALGLGDDGLEPRPFPLGGLAAWCDGPLTRSRLNLLRQAEARVAADLFRLGDGTALTQAAVRLAVTATGTETLIIEAVRADDGLAAQPDEAVPGFWPEVAERLRSLMPGLRHVCLDLAPSPAGTLPG